MINYIKEIFLLFIKYSNWSKLIILIMILILLFNPDLIANFSLSQYFESDSTIIFRNIFQFSFRSYFTLLPIFFYLICVLSMIVIVIRLFTNMISDNHVKNFLFNSLKITWFLLSDIFLIILFLMLLYFGQTFIHELANYLSDPSKFEIVPIIDKNGQIIEKFIYHIQIVDSGIIPKDSLGIIFFLLFVNSLFMITYILYKMFNSENKLLLN